MKGVSEKLVNIYENSIDSWEKWGDIIFGNRGYYLISLYDLTIKYLVLPKHQHSSIFII